MNDFELYMIFVVFEHMMMVKDVFPFEFAASV
jgi:hypothetical protein